MNSQIKSRQRVKDRAEVFTNEREVNAMLDLLEKEAYTINSRFLEPACGTGNFLVKILERKLSVIDTTNLKEYEEQTIDVVRAIYGIDICQDI